MSKLYKFDEIAWHVPPTDVSRTDVDARAGDDEPGRKFLAQGEGGFYSQVVRIPPNFDAPVHTHNHSEIFMVLAGGCRFNGQDLRPFDQAVIEAGEPYGFTSGPDGLQFLVIRQDVATFAAVE